MHSDPRFSSVVKTIDIGPARADYIIVDPIGRRLYGLGDEVIDVDTDNGNVVSRIKVPSRSAMNCLDSTTKLAFNPNHADSTETVVHEDSPDRYTVVEKPSTGGAARTCAVDPKTHKLYVFYYEGNPRQGGKLIAAVLRMPSLVAQVVTAVATGILLQVILMVFLGAVPRRRGLDSRRDRLLPLAGSLYACDHLFGDLRLLR